MPSYPTNYNLLGSTTLANGTINNLQVNDGVYMSFHSYPTAFSGSYSFGYTTKGSSTSTFNNVLGSRFTTGISGGLAYNISAYLGFTSTNSNLGNTNTGYLRHFNNGYHDGANVHNSCFSSYRTKHLSIHLLPNKRQKHESRHLHVKWCLSCHNRTKKYSVRLLSRLADLQLCVSNNFNSQYPVWVGCLVSIRNRKCRPLLQFK